MINMGKGRETDGEMGRERERERETDACSYCKEHTRISIARVAHRTYMGRGRIGDIPFVQLE